MARANKGAGAKAPAGKQGRKAPAGNAQTNGGKEGRAPPRHKGTGASGNKAS